MIITRSATVFLGTIVVLLGVGFLLFDDEHQVYFNSSEANLTPNLENPPILSSVGSRNQALWSSTCLKVIRSYQFWICLIASLVCIAVVVVYCVKHRQESDPLPESVIPLVPVEKVWLTKKNLLLIISPIIFFALVAIFHFRAKIMNFIYPRYDTFFRITKENELILIDCQVKGLKKIPRVRHNGAAFYLNNINPNYVLDQWYLFDASGNYINHFSDSVIVPSVLFVKRITLSINNNPAGYDLTVFGNMLQTETLKHEKAKQIWDADKKNKVEQKDDESDSSDLFMLAPQEEPLVTDVNIFVGDACPRAEWVMRPPLNLYQLCFSQYLHSSGTFSGHVEGLDFPTTSAEFFAGTLEASKAPFEIHAKFSMR